MDQYPSEVSIIFVIYFQVAIQVYFTAVMVHFFIFCYTKPELESSLRNIRCVRAKYCAFWLLVIFIMLLLQICSFYVAYTISDYNKKWLSVLHKISGGYECTSDSLWINVQLLQ